MLAKKICYHNHYSTTTYSQDIPKTNKYNSTKVGFDTQISTFSLRANYTILTSANQTQPNLPNATYKTHPTKANLPNPTYQTQLTKPNLTYQPQPYSYSEQYYPVPYKTTTQDYHRQLSTT